MGLGWVPGYVRRRPARAIAPATSSPDATSNLPYPMLTTRVPPELLDMIVNSVEKQNDLLALALTCRRFFHLARPLLIQRSARSRREALHWACIHGHVETVEAMLEAGAAMSPFHPWVWRRKFSMPLWYWPLEEARLVDRESLLPDLYEPGVEESYSCAIQNLRAPLHIAAAWRQVEVVRILVAVGVSPLYHVKTRRAAWGGMEGKYREFDAIDWAMTLSPLAPDIMLPQEAAKVCEILRILLKDLPVVRNEYLTYICDQWLQGKWQESCEKEAYILEIVRTLVDLGADPHHVISEPRRWYLECHRCSTIGVSVAENAITFYGGKLRNLNLLEALLERDVAAEGC